MSNNQPFTWNPSDVIEVTNITDENILLKLDSGLLRIDAGRTLRLTETALEQPQLVQLIRQNKIKSEKFNWRKRK